MADGASHKSDLPESPGSRTSRAPCSIGVVVDEPVGEVRKLEQADRPALVREVVHKYPAKNERRSDVPPEEVGVRVHTVKACEERSQTDEDAQDEELVKGELEDVVVVPVGHGREAVGIGHGGQGGNADWLVVLDMCLFRVLCCGWKLPEKKSRNKSVEAGRERRKTHLASTNMSAVVALCGHDLRTSFLCSGLGGWVARAEHNTKHARCKRKGSRNGGES